VEGGATRKETDLYDAVKNGASGYLLKDSSIHEVAPAIRVVADGRSLISPSMAIKLLDEFKQLSSNRGKGPTPRVTPRELVVRSPAPPPPPRSSGCSRPAIASDRCG
jgi:DNA-binding NarL/FixJ family response regulator